MGPDRHIMMVTTAKYIYPETDSVYRKEKKPTVFNLQIKTSGSILKGGGQGTQWGHLLNGICIVF